MSIQELPTALHVVDPPVGLAAPSRLRWTTLRYRLPDVSSRHRVSVWRALQDARALNLGRALWAVGHQEDDRPRLDDVFDRVAEAGGAASTDVVDRDEPARADLDARLARECERLWDTFFLHLDHVDPGRLRGDDADPAARLDAVERLREEFRELLTRDLVGSDASRRAAYRLDELTELVVDGPGAPPDGADEERPRHEVERLVTWAFEDGHLRSDFVVDPLPPLDWERAFAAFEARTYVPRADRPPLRHGSFQCVHEPGEAPALTVDLQQRVRRFEQSLC